MFKETFWYPVNYAHISSANDDSLIRSSFQQSRVLVSWFPGMQGRAEHQHSQLGPSVPLFASCCTLTEPSCRTLNHEHATATALCAAKQTAGSILEGSLSPLLLCRDDSFVQHYSAQVSSQEARVYRVHQHKAEITFISLSKSRADQTKRDNRTVAKTKQWNSEDSLTLLYFYFLP